MKLGKCKPTHEIYYSIPSVLNVINCHLQLHRHAKYIQAAYTDLSNTLNFLPKAKQLINFMGLERWHWEDKDTLWSQSYGHLYNKTFLSFTPTRMASESVPEELVRSWKTSLVIIFHAIKNKICKCIQLKVCPFWYKFEDLSQSSPLENDRDFSFLLWNVTTTLRKTKIPE